MPPSLAGKPPMPIVVTCWQCGKSGVAPDKAAGRNATCKKCGSKVVVPLLITPPASNASALTAQARPLNSIVPTVSKEVLHPPPRVRSVEVEVTNEKVHPANQPTTNYCYACAAPIDARAEICPKCGVRQQRMLAEAARADPAVRKASGNKIAAGLCGIFVVALGIHKFVLGLTKPGIIMLCHRVHVRPWLTSRW